MSNAPLSRWLGITLLLVVAVVFGANHIAARLAFDHGVSVTTAVTVRSAVTALAVLPLLMFFNVRLSLPALTLRRAVLIGVVLAVQSYCLYSAVARIPAALALLVFNLHPMLLTLLSWGAGGDRPSRRSLIAMPIGLLGLALALDVGGSGFTARSAGFGDAIAGVSYALVAGFSFAIAMFLSARWLQGVDGRLRSCLMMATVAVLAFTGGGVSGTLALPADASAWLGLALLTLFYGTAITSLFILLPRLASPADIAALNFEPIAVLLVAWVFLGQALAPMQVAGALIVVAAIFAIGTGKH